MLLSGAAVSFALCDHVYFCVKQSDTATFFVSIIIIIVIANEKIKVMLSRKTLQGHFTRS